MSFELKSDAFYHGELIPARYTCDGEDLSPPLEWTNAPDNVRSFALIADDPDAPVGTWIHWVLYNTQGETEGLTEGVASNPELPDGRRHGQNSWGRMSYGGPCPPGGTHRYFFKLNALDGMLDLTPGATKDQLLQTMEGRIVGRTELMGRYSRG